MAVYKEEKTNTWRVIYRYTDWKGERRQSQKRGFATKREAQAWEREQLNKTKADLDMTFASFVDTYTEDMKSRIKENTWHTKEHIMRTKILPYFKNRKMCEIEPKDIIAWQNEMKICKNKRKTCCKQCQHISRQKNMHILQYKKSKTMTILIYRSLRH